MIDGAWDGDQAQGTPAGDINGDGLDDIIVETRGGPVYVVFGKANKRTVELGEFPSRRGVVLEADLPEYADLHATPAGDVNGDGFDDILVTTLGRNGGAKPVVYVVFGARRVASVVLDELAPTAGRKIYVPSASTGWVEALGDVNGDGFDDLAVVHGSCCVVQIHVIYGDSDLQEVDDADLSAEIGGFIIDGFYWTEVAAGDINGDGFADIVVESIAQYDSEDARVYVIFGGAEMHGYSFPSDGDGGFEGLTITRPGAARLSIASGGDVNGDGRDDIVLAAANWAEVVFGQEDTAPIVLSEDLAGGGGFSIALDSSGSPGHSITARLGPDLNGDGLDEVVLIDERSVFNQEPRPDDQVHVIYGKADGDPVTAGSGEGGFSFDATPSDVESGAFGGWAQIDGAGGLDLVLSAHEGERGTPEQARVFVFFRETPE